MLSHTNTRALEMGGEICFSKRKKETCCKRIKYIFFGFPDAVFPPKHVFVFVKFIETSFPHDSGFRR